jgi:hypothetical protein
MGESIDLDPYHVPVIRGTMTRSLPVVFPEIREEVMNAFKEFVPTNGHGVFQSMLVPLEF